MTLTTAEQRGKVLFGLPHYHCFTLILEYMHLLSFELVKIFKRWADSTQFHKSHRLTVQISSNSSEQINFSTSQLRLSRFSETLSAASHLRLSRFSETLSASSQLRLSTFSETLSGASQLRQKFNIPKFDGKSQKLGRVWTPRTLAFWIYAHRQIAKQIQPLTRQKISSESNLLTTNTKFYTQCVLLHIVCNLHTVCNFAQFVILHTVCNFTHGCS